MLRWQKFFLLNFFNDKEFLKIFFFNSAIKKIEDKDLSWQEFIDDKIFLRQKTIMAKISIPKTIMRRKFMTAIYIINFFNKIFHDTTFMIKISW